MNNHDMIPVESFLHRVFPAGLYDDSADDILKRRLFKPRKDCDNFELPRVIDWEAEDRNEDRNWRMQLQGWTMFHPVINFFDEYARKEEAVALFFDIAESWWKNYKNDPDDIVTSRMPSSYAWYDMSVGFRALVIGFFANRIQHFRIPITDDQQKLLEQIARKHAANLNSEKTFSLNNHGIFQAHGLMALSRILHELPGADHAIRHATTLMERLVETQFDANGVHLEHSPHYHFYVLNSFEAVLKSGWYADTDFSRRIELAQAACKWLVDPLKRPICVGDSILTVQKNLKFPTGGDEMLLSEMDDSGYAVARSGWNVPADKATMVFLMGAYHSKTHKHRDCLSFDWFDAGGRIICDGGKFGYKKDRFRHYCLSSQAHNSVEIEGLDVIKMRPYGSAILQSEKLANGIYRLSAALNYAAIKHRRNLYIKPGSWVIVEDELEYARARNSVQWFHLETDYRLGAASDLSVFATGEKGRQLYIDCFSPDTKMELHYGDKEALQGFVSKNDYQIEPALTVGFKVQGSRHRLLTSLALNEAARKSARAFLRTVLDATAPDIDTLGDSSPLGALPNIPHHITPALEKISYKPGKATYQTHVENMRLNFFYHGKGKKKLAVMLPGASSRSKGPIDYQRYTWTEDFPDHDILVLTDPTLKPENDITLAWFQHDRDSYGLTALSRLIEHVVNQQGFKPSDVTLFGSSGGGFGALQLAGIFPEARVIAINPQIYLYNYTRSFFEKMLETCYPGMSEAEVLKQHRERITVQIDPQHRQGQIFIFQNIYDDKHLNRHLKPFLKKVKHDILTITDWKLSGSSAEKLCVVYFSDSEAGHSPPSKENTLTMMKGILL